LVEIRHDGRDYEVNLYPRGARGILSARIRPSGERTWNTARSTGTNDPIDAKGVVEGWIETQQLEQEYFWQWAVRDWDWKSSPRIGLKRKANPQWAGRDHCYNTQTQLRKYLPKVFPKRRLNEIKPKDLLLLADFLLDQRLKSRTVKHILTATRTSLLQAYRMGLHPIADWPLPDLAADEKPRQPFSVEEISRLLRASESNPELHTVIRIAASTGARIGEILAMRAKSLGSGKIRIDRTRTRSGTEKLPKSGQPREIDVTPQLEEYLRQFTAGKSPDAYVVSTRGEPSLPVDYRLLLRAFNQTCSTAGVERRPKDAFHSFRHAHATALVTHRVPLEEVQRRLGHASPETTLRYTTKASPPASEELRRAVSAIERSSSIPTPVEQLSPQPVTTEWRKLPLKGSAMELRQRFEWLIRNDRISTGIEAVWSNFGEGGTSSAFARTQIDMRVEKASDFIRFIDWLQKEFVDVDDFDVLASRFTLNGKDPDLHKLRDLARKVRKADTKGFHDRLLESLSNVVATPDPESPNPELLIGKT
jgi:integrase